MMLPVCLTPDRPLPRLVLGGVLALTLLAFLLRLLAAQGGIWLDEAWSVIFAGEAAPVVGVFASIHHDNNHHLNTLWLQLTGAGAPSPALRGLSILSGTLSVWIAALIGARRGSATALSTALFFALSPMLVLYGSEARGYAPMLACFLACVLIAQRWMDEEDAAFPANGFALLALLGTLAHMMMVIGLALLAGWAGLVLWRRHGLKAALVTSGQTLFLPLIISASVIGFIFASAKVVAGGMTIGSFSPYAAPLFHRALGELTSLTSGLGAFGSSNFAGLGVLLLLCLWRPKSLPLLPVLLIIALPLAVMLFHPGNSHFSRYYLMSAIGMLLLLGDRIGAMQAAGTLWRALGLMLLVAFSVTSLLQIRQMIAVGRGHPDAPVALLQKELPQGARVSITHSRAEAVLRVAAAQRAYPLVLVRNTCAPADALFIEREPGEAVRQRAMHCNHVWHVSASADALGPSGQSWTLYTPVETVR